VGQRPRRTQPFEQGQRLVDPLRSDQALHQIASDPAIRRHSAGRQVLEQRPRGVELAGLEVAGHDLRSLGRRHRHAEDHHPVEHATGSCPTACRQRHVDERLEVRARRDPSVGGERQRIGPGTVDVACGQPRLEHRVAVEAGGLRPGGLHRIERRSRRRRIAGLGVSQQQLGVHVPGELDPGRTQSLEQVKRPVGVAGASDHGDQLGGQPRSRLPADIEHELDDGARVLDGAAIETVAEQTLVLGWRRCLTVLRQLPQHRAGRRVPPGAQVDG
jgi:hypothetical protein